MQQTTPNAAEALARVRGRKIGRHGIKLFWSRGMERWVTIPGAGD